MKVSEKGLALIKDFEGCALVPYKCPGGVLTIGYGHTRGVTKDMRLKPEDADELLLRDLEIYENAVNRKIKRTLTQGEFDALVSFIYNLGAGKLSGEFLSDINAGRTDAVCARMKLYVKAGGKKLLGLERRRNAECALYKGGLP